MKSKTPASNPGSGILRNENHPLDQYCLELSHGPSESLQSLASYTQQNVPGSMMLVGPLVGGFLQLLVKAIQAKRVLELGCYTGYSALCMAEALPRDGELITIDIDVSNAEVAKSHWCKNPHGKKIEMKIGSGLDVIPTLKAPFDLVFIDADKKNYARYFDLCFPLVRSGGLIVSDNCLQGGDVLHHPPSTENAVAIHDYNLKLKNRQDCTVMLLPLRDGISIALKH
jgi:caffeoyl-CoA O-methyltransferase